jgi:biopolymer transport protein ExbD
MHLQQVKLPSETNEPVKNKPEDVNITVNKDGDVYWGQKKLANSDELFELLKKESVKLPQPAVHVRGDMSARYEAIGRVMFQAQRAGVQKVGFVIEPPDKG